MNDCKEYRPTRLQRITKKLFPYVAPKELPEREGGAPGGIVTKIMFRLDWKDRVRLAVSRRVVVELRQQTDVAVSWCDSEAALSVEAPWESMHR